MASSALQPTGKKAPALQNGPKGQRKSRAQPNRKRKLLLTDGLPDMMFGFGDVELPLQSTVDTVEDVVLAYLGRLVKRASSASTHRGRLTEQELLIQVRTDPRKYHRAKDLLMKWGEIKTAKANNIEVDGTRL